MKKCIIICTLLSGILVIALGVHALGKTNPYPQPEEYKPQVGYIKIHIMSKEDINNKKPDYIHYDRVEGFSIWKELNGKMIPGTCEIYTPPPNTADQIDTLLHEIMHCQVGGYHG